MNPALFPCLPALLLCEPSSLSGAVETLLPDVDALYRDLHQHPELSEQEERTSAKLAARLRALGFTVTTRVGGHGLVGVLSNGPGPVLMLRTDMDALPIREDTGLPYASRAEATGAGGATVPVMHACGHDLHMAAWVGAASILALRRDHWNGTLVMVGQPAEEIGQGARRMIAAGLFTRFPRPSLALAVHDTPKIAAGAVGFTSGAAMAGTTSVDVTIFGRGGDGAEPQSTIDPVVIAARLILALQTIVSRESDPREPAVVTVGSVHGGTKHDVIPEDVHLQLTLRSFNEKTARRLTSAVERVARAEAAASGSPRPPLIVINPGSSPTYNDPDLTSRTAAAVERELGLQQVLRVPAEMTSEDFSEYGLAGVPATIFWVGAGDGAADAGLHSPRFAPARMSTLRTAIRALTAAALELLRPHPSIREASP